MYDIHSCTTDLEAILYADDSTFSFRMASFNESNLNIPFPNPSINHELNKISLWLRSNRMCLNVSKTKYIIFNRLSTSPDLKLYMNGIELEKVENFNFLGLYINEKLDWTLHLNLITGKLSRVLGILSSLKKLHS